MLRVTAGKVPGGVAEFQVEEGTTLLEALEQAAEIIGEKRSLGEPAFEVHTEDYAGKGGQNTIDVPQVGGEILANFDKTTSRWTDIKWDRECNDGDVILVVPKIQGNQLLVEVNGETIAIYEPGDAEGGTYAGTVYQALNAAKLALTDGDVILVNGKIAEMNSELHAGDTVKVVNPEDDYELIASEEDVLAMEGVDVEELRKTAKALTRKAKNAAAKIREYKRKLREFSLAASAAAVRADEIEKNMAQYEAARARLKKLGVKVR